MNLIYGLLEKGYMALIIGEGAVGNVVAENGAAGEGGFFTWSTILLWVGMFGALYFFLIRPQSKRNKMQTAMQQGLKVGDRVLTASGFYGKIVDVGTDAFMVEFGDNRGIRIPVRKSDIVGVKSPNMAPPGREAIEDKREDKKEDRKEDKKEDKKDEKEDNKLL